jgi:hypothetical protein
VIILKSPGGSSTPGAGGGARRFILSLRRFLLLPAPVELVNGNLQIQVEPQNSACRESASVDDPTGSKAIPKMGSCACVNRLGRLLHNSLPHGGN